MSPRATTVRIALGGALAALVGGTVLTAMAADVTTGCSYTDPAGDAAVMGSDPFPPTAPAPDGDVDFTSIALAGDVVGFTVVAKLVALQEFTTKQFNGDRHEIRFTAAGKAVVIGASRFVDNPVSNMYPVTKYSSVGGTAVTPASYKVVYNVKASTITYELSSADLKTMLGVEPGGQTLSGITAQTWAKTTPQNNGDLNSDTAALGADKVYGYGIPGCKAAPAPAPSGSAGPSASGTPSASGSPSASGTPRPSGSASSTPSATASGTPRPSGSSSPTPSGTASPAAGTQMTFTGATRVQFGDSFATTVTLKDSSGKPLAGKRVTAKHGTAAAVAGTTNSVGQVKLTTPAKDKAGRRNVVVSFAGDSSSPAKTLNRAITTVVEVTRLTKTVSGSGTTRTVTIQLTDDDATKKALAGRTLTFSYSGRTVTLKTDSTGRAKVTARTGAAMDITFAGESGAYAPVKISTFAK